MWPSDDELLAAWRRLVADPTANGPLAELVLKPLEADLARQFPHAHPDDRADAADTAVAAFLLNPTAFDPTRGPLPAFLRMAARRDLANLLDREARHKRGRIPWAGVESSHPARNEEVERLSFADFPELQAVIDALDETDRRVFDLMKDGERETAVFAAALEITDRPPDEQAAVVKRAKDRIKARLIRAGGSDE